MSYCVVGVGSDVSAYFHRMGHLVCETCQQDFPTKGGLSAHLRDHQQRGDRVPQSGFDLLRDQQEAGWNQAMLEGQASISLPRPISLVHKVLMLILNL